MSRLEIDIHAERGHLYPECATILLALVLCIVELCSTVCAQPYRVPAATTQFVRPPPQSAPYMLPDGTVFVAGSDIVAPFFRELTQVYVRAHPNIKFTLLLKDSPLGIAGITSGKSAFAPMGRGAARQDIDGFTARFGYPPTDFLIGYDESPDPDIFPPGKSPPAVWINVLNPLPWLTLQRVARIFQTGGLGGDITYWSQVGVGGRWGDRKIHVYMSNVPIPFWGYRMGGRPWTKGAEWLPTSSEVMDAVAQDPFGIGVIGWWPPDSGWDHQAEWGSRVKLLPLAKSANARVSRGGVGEVYPLVGGIHIYVNEQPGKRLPRWLEAYIRLALSRKGQEILASMTKEYGLVPLGPRQRATQVAKLK